MVPHLPSKNLGFSLHFCPFSLCTSCVFVCMTLTEGFDQSQAEGENPLASVGGGGATTTVQEGQDEAWLREMRRRQGRLWGEENKHFAPAALPGGLVRRSQEKGGVRGDDSPGQKQRPENLAPGVTSPTRAGVLSCFELVEFEAPLRQQV